MNEAKAAIQWLACAGRPLYLEELADACIVQLDSTAPFSEDARLSPWAILELLPGLVKVEPGLGQAPKFIPKHHTVSLAHFSVKEYLLSTRVQSGRMSYYGVDTNLANQHIVRSCMAYLDYCLSLSKPSEANAKFYPLMVYAYRHWAYHVTLLPIDCHVAMDDVISHFKKPRSCILWSAMTLQLRMIRDENNPYVFEIPLDPLGQPDWSFYYLLCCAIIMDNRPIIKRRLDDGLELRGNWILGDPLRLAIACAYQPKKPASINLASQVSPLHNEPFSGGNLVVSLLAAGCQVHKQHFFLAAESCSDRVVSSVLNEASFSFKVLLQGIKLALMNQRNRNADLVFDNLTCKIFGCDSKDVQNALFRQVFNIAISFDSVALMEYILRRLPVDVLRRTDLNELLLRVVIEDNTFAAMGITKSSRVSVSKASRRLVAEWNSLMGHHPQLRSTLLVICTRLWQGKMTRLYSGHNMATVSKLLSEAVHKLSSKSLVTTLEVLRVCFGSLSALDSQVNGRTWKILSLQRRRLSASQNLALFAILKSPWSYLAWAIVADKFIQLRLYSHFTLLQSVRMLDYSCTFLISCPENWMKSVFARLYESFPLQDHKIGHNIVSLCGNNQIHLSRRCNRSMNRKVAFEATAQLLRDRFFKLSIKCYTDNDHFELSNTFTLLIEQTWVKTTKGPINEPVTDRLYSRLS
ncbi:hypothetical protein F4819DRAFT_64940 [Hypoxylon fuscum]|nr:hypothetical protein F4819DRAFT_64940 [Hypoxylon fuscum]